MSPLSLREFHLQLGGRFATAGAAEFVNHYGDPLLEYAALTQATGVLDLSFRGCICLTGADRIRFLHGQVTNNINGLRLSGGCYAALITAKGKMQSDLNIYNLGEELLLDFEPNLTQSIVQRLEKYVIADDVQMVEIESLYGLLSLQGPDSEQVLKKI
jgi:folate-binding Fe-S cluster repair protein YgfZ